MGGRRDRNSCHNVATKLDKDGGKKKENTQQQGQGQRN